MIVWLLACTPEAPELPSSPGGWTLDPRPVGAEVVGAAGNRSASAWVRSFNAYGGSVLSSATEVDVNGEATSVSISGTGYGELTFDEAGSYELTVGVSSEWVHVYGADFAGFGLQRGAPAPVSVDRDGIAGGEGVLFMGANDVWWTGPDAASHRVLRTRGEIRGAVAGMFDGDGVLDALVWAGTDLHLLRGREGGGMTWFGTLESDTHTIGGADMGDVTVDGVSDVVVAWNGGESDHRLDVWEHDGLLGLDGRPNHPLTYAPFDVSIGSETGEERNQITVADGSGTLTRLYPSQWGFVLTGPSLLFEFEPDTQVHSVPDLAGDGGARLAFFPRRTPGADRRLLLFDVTSDEPTFAGFTSTGSWLGFADFDGNGSGEILTMDEAGSLVWLGIDGNTYTTAFIDTELEPGAVAPVPDASALMVGGATTWMTYRLEPGDTGSVAIDRELVSPGLTVRDGVFDVRTTHNGPEITAVRAGDGSSQLRVYHFEGDEVVTRGTVTLDAEARTVLDLARCGDTVFVLLESGLHGVDVSDPSNPVGVTSSWTGSRVSCDGELGALLTEDGIVRMDGALQEQSTETRAGARDIAVHPTGVASCDQEGCRIEAGAVGVNGVVVEVVGWPGGASIDGELVMGSGVPTLADVDGNGALDVLFHDAGRIVLYRHTGDRLGPAEIHVTSRDFLGPLGIVDLDGDGNLDAWGVESTAFRLRVTPPATGGSPDPQPTDTADTGHTGAETADTSHTGVN